MRSVCDRFLARLCVAIVALVFSAAAAEHSTARPEERSLKLYNIHTEEFATIVFKRNGVYDRAALEKLNLFLRDWRKDRPTNMDPQLFDLLWQVYQQSGSHDYIHVVCGYRSPETNGMLRRRSRGVAKNSLHMQGKAMDFFIPGVALAKLRVIGLRMQLGGVGFYPTSGSPFVHMDTGSVRHWPRMTRQELVSVFPNGRTLHVPSDGQPLPGYAQALAAYQARKASGTAVASFVAETPAADTGPIQLAAVNPDEVDDAIAAAAPAPAPMRKAVAVASYATTPTPLPRLAPRPVAAPSLVVAEAPPPAPRRSSGIMVLASAAFPSAGAPAPDFDFGQPQDWTAPAVPADLAKAMAERDQTRRGASLPIPPTAVVATIDVSRPLRAAAITTAVLRKSSDPIPPVPRVMAYAPLEPMPVIQPQRARMTSAGVPLPQLRPRQAIARLAAPNTRSVAPALHMLAPELTLTTLDTQGLRLWIGTASTRQKSYALLTMPDFAQTPDLMTKPTISFGAGFGRVAYVGLRTDRFAGPLVQQPEMVDLTVEPLIASIR